MKLFLTSVVVFSSAIMSCGKANHNSEVKNVFGSEDREEITTSQYPWRAIGAVFIGSSQCTGTLVAKDLVLTAAHCVMDPATKELTSEPISFLPNYIDGRAEDSSSVSQVWWGTRDPNSYRGNDWAILKLTKNLGETYGWLGALNNDIASFPDQLTVAGYSSDFKNGRTAGVHHNCNTRGRNAAWGMIFHDCDTSRGSSGGPALRMVNDKLTIVGINVAEFRKDGEVSLYVPQYDAQYANIAIPSGQAVKKILEITGQN